MNEGTDKKMKYNESRDDQGQNMVGEANHSKRKGDFEGRKGRKPILKRGIMGIVRNGVERKREDLMTRKKQMREKMIKRDTEDQKTIGQKSNYLVKG
jgi:hypothetical protein